MGIPKKMFISIVTFLILPFLLLGFLYSEVMTNVIMNNLDDSSYELLEQMERNILSKTERLQNKTDVLVLDSRLQRILRENDFNEASLSTHTSQLELNELMEQYFYDEKDLKDIILLFDDGGIYTYKGEIERKNRASYMLLYGQMDEKAKGLSWSGLQNSSEEGETGTVVARLNIFDSTYKKDYKRLATAYFVFGSDFFEHILGQQRIDDEYFMICTSAGAKLFTHGQDPVPDLWNFSIMINREVYEKQHGSLRVSHNGEDFIMIFYTSPILNWKYIRLAPYKLYFSKVESLKFMTVGIAVLLFAILCVASYLWIRRLTRPVHAIVLAMQEVGKQNFDVSLPIESKDEFGIIAKGFNEMAQEIRELFRCVLLEEKRSKEAELIALQYQINPHFLYNTLNSIRLTALFNKQHDIAEMLYLLGNFLRNTLSSANKLVDLRDEIQNLKTYIALYQIRYGDKIKTQFAIDENLEEVYIYSMLLQPVVENAIIHGLGPRLASGEEALLCISTSSEDNRLIIRIRDNGPGMGNEQCNQILNGNGCKQSGTHIGLFNIRQRIKYLYGQEYDVSIDSKPGSFTEVSFALPIIEHKEGFDYELTTKLNERQDYS